MSAEKKTARPANEPAAAEAKPAAAEAEPAAAETEPAAAEAEPALAEEPPPAEELPLNRAARRAQARGRKGSVPQPTGRGKATRGTGPAPGPRMWANRRSG